MKTITKLFTAGLISTSICASTLAANLDVTFKNIEKQEGNLMVALYNSEENYKGKGKPVQVAQIPAIQANVTYSFDNLEDGTYAIKLFHDANSNGKMDTNQFGIPMEGYGFSNNVGKFGPPEFVEAGFEVNTDLHIEILVR